MSTTMVDKRKDFIEQRKVDNKSYVPVRYMASSNI